jgi:hypothetical protein
VVDPGLAVDPGDRGVPHGPPGSLFKTIANKFSSRVSAGQAIKQDHVRVLE